MIALLLIVVLAFYVSKQLGGRVQRALSDHLRRHGCAGMFSEPLQDLHLVSSTLFKDAYFTPRNGVTTHALIAFVEAGGKTYICFREQAPAAAAQA